MKAKQLDKLFDASGDISKYLDISRAKRTNEAPQRVNVDFPAWMIHCLDKEAGRLGVPRQSVIKVWISERLSDLRTARETWATHSKVADKGEYFSKRSKKRA